MTDFDRLNNEVFNEDVKLNIAAASILASIIGYTVALSTNSLVRGAQYTGLLLIILIPVIIAAYWSESNQ